MTCASCSNTITSALLDLDGVSDVAIDLIGNSGAVTVVSRSLVDKVVEAVEDCGYTAEVDDVRPLHPSPSKQPKASATTQPLRQRPTVGPRTIALRVEGMYCAHCPPRVMASLQRYVDQGELTIVKPLTAGVDPIIEVSYTPSAPHFTIRDIISAISHAKDSDSTFTVSVYKPPTLEERSRVMHAREQRSLLQRLAFAVIVAIPTFIIGVVYMSLVPKTNETRMWFMSPMWAGNASRVEWALFFLSTPVYVYSAGTFHRRALKELRALWRPGSKVPVWKRFVRFGSMNLLISAGTSVAYFASIALLALAASQPRMTMGEGDVTTYFDSVVFLAMFLLIGRYMEAYSKGRTADAITALGKLRPSTALLVAPVDAVSPPSTPVTRGSTADVEKATPGSEELVAGKGMKVQTINTDLLEVGDVVRVLSGSTPPADGTIVASSGAGAEVQAIFDESSLTGESKPVNKTAGDQVYLGTINRGRVVDVRVDAVGGESMLDHIVSVVREGHTKRAPIERVADHITAYFVPVVTLLAILTWAIWLGLGLSGALPADYLDVDVGGWPVWSLEFAIAVFVVACPCGIGLAAPTALLVGSGLAARFGILARGGGEAFQETAQLDLIAFDKTGTITEGGEPKVTDTDFASDHGLTREQVLGVVLEMESMSGHPLALALQRFCRENGAASISGSQHEETPGRGLGATFERLGYDAAIGNEAWMAAHNAHLDGRMHNVLDGWKAQGKSVVLLALSPRQGASRFEGVAAFAIADPVRPEAAPVLECLQTQGISVWMISGDNETTAKAVAKVVGIPSTNVIAGVLPHEKADKIRWLQQVGQKRPVNGWLRLFKKRSTVNERCVVGFVGDGINDAPALAAADVGIAIGSGSDVAISSASFVLVSSNLKALLVLCDLSRKVFRRVKLNFLWALMYNMAALPIAAGVVYPAGHARLDPVWASLAMALSSVSVVCSSLLLKLYREPRLKM
ncbi:heavy metal translocatin [Exidia glandulosa HHB12029]|uniref:Heavy metal translocatin n=1 Tax=Exidia glandulosa HHB12029 TaxID=1314781 RepID=A0A165PY95_EXIGL|nr:heavy metal translocatin [Exidia glandulosa HHB12029]